MAQGHISLSALTEQAQRQGTRALTNGPERRVRVREVVSCDLGRAIKIGWGDHTWGGERLRAAPLLSAAVKSPKLGQARARVVPGSPRLGREGENNTANSVAGK
jgi:hypothetical protein